MEKPELVVHFISVIQDKEIDALQHHPLIDIAKNGFLRRGFSKAALYCLEKDSVRLLGRIDYDVIPSAIVAWPKGKIVPEEITLLRPKHHVPQNYKLLGCLRLREASV